MKRYYGITAFLLGLFAFSFASFVNAAKIYLVSQNDNLISNCENNIDIMIDTEGEEIFGAAVTMTYDRKNINIVGLYLNDEFNLPHATKISKSGDIGEIESVELSLLRDKDFKQRGFTGTIKYGTLVVKNTEPISSTKIGFIFDGIGSTSDNMDVFRLPDAKDVLSTVKPSTFDLMQGICKHSAPIGYNQIDEGYNYKVELEKNLQNINNVEKIYKYKLFFMNYGLYSLILLLLLVLLFVMRKKGLFKNKKVLVNKENKNV